MSAQKTLLITPEMVVKARMNERNLLFLPHFVPAVIVEDEPLHTDEHPYCSDPTCPCQADREVSA